MIEAQPTCTSEDPCILSDLEQFFEVFGSVAHWETDVVHREGAVHWAAFLSAKYTGVAHREGAAHWA